MNPLHIIGDTGLLYLLKRNVVAEVQGIRLVAFGAEPKFVPVVTRALELICSHDQRRFHRVQKHIRWIFAGAVWGGAGWAQYFHRIKACKIDFHLNSDLGDELTHAAGYAGLIVHEATHGAIKAYHINATPQNDERIERLCYAEQSRFARRLRAVYPDMPASVDSAYNPKYYETLQASSKLRLLRAEVQRAFRRIAEQDGAANGSQPIRSETNSTSGTAGSRR
jgi:hypothetical protein